MHRKIKILIYGNTMARARSVVTALRQDGIEPDWTRVDSEQEVAAALAEDGWNAVIADGGTLGDSIFKVLETCRNVRRDLPFIVISDLIDVDTAVQLARAGANDCIHRRDIRCLGASLNRIMDEAVAPMRGTGGPRGAFEAAAACIVITDVRNRITAANPAFAALTGYDRDRLIGVSLDGFERVLGAATGDWSSEVEIDRKDGTTFPAWVSASVVTDGAGRFVERVLVVNDVTEARGASERIRYQANFDALTGLPNRYLFFDRLDQSINRARRDRESLAVLFIDLDHFKVVNDSLGHAAGDQLLSESAERMTAFLRATDTIARIGGDEFAIVLPSIGRERSALRIAEKISDALARPFNLGGTEALISASIGISVFPDDGEDGETLLAGADAAMNVSKQAGRGSPPVVTASGVAEKQSVRAGNDNIRVAETAPAGGDIHTAKRPGLSARAVSAAAVLVVLVGLSFAGGLLVANHLAGVDAGGLDQMADELDAEELNGFETAGGGEEPEAETDENR